MYRLMIVDDEEIIRESLSQMIDYASLGYQLIASAKNGMEAYDVICDEYPDVVITDIRMPFLDGLELIQRAREADSHIAFILLSGYGEFEYAKQAMKYGVKYYFLKPTDKQELIDALCSIREEFRQEEEREARRQQQILCRLQLPLRQCFIMDALEHLEDFHDIYLRYVSFLSIPSDCRSACICSFVEETCLHRFLQDVVRILADDQLELYFPLLCVKNSVVIFAPFDTPSRQRRFQNQIRTLSYPGQSVSFEAVFLQSDTSEELFHIVMKKISRFERILMIEGEETLELHNNLTSFRKLHQIEHNLSQLSDQPSGFRYLENIFPDELSLESAKDLALNLYLRHNPHQPPEHACDFFGKLYSCSTNSEIRQLMQFLLYPCECERTAGSSDNISLLKAYVERHLHSENLSLKWLAENYLFVSVGYLSKQFIKEEGIRFSAYLNQKRMDEAIRLMEEYPDENVKFIASQVGYGYNPQYFSQVFKRYTGLTPRDYIERLKKNRAQDENV